MNFHWIFYRIAGTYPFEDGPQLIDKIKKGVYSCSGKRWEKVSKGAIQLVQGLMNVNPQKRLTATEALKSQWLM